MEARGSAVGRLHRHWLACALVLSLVGAESTVRAEDTVCRQGISADTAARLFAILKRAPEADCTFEGVETNGAHLEARWSRRAAPLPPVRVAPRECMPDVAQHAGRFAIDVPSTIVENCPSVVPFIAAFVKQVVNEKPVASGNATGSLDDPLFRGARALFVATAIVVGGLLIRGATRRRSLDACWLVVGIASFAGALALRAALPFSLGNWYSEVLPASGPPPWMRFGPGYFALQSLLRDAGIWDARALALSQLLMGAAALPLLLGVLWELRVGLEASAATLVLFIFAPFHARLSATTSEHVPAATLCLGLLLSWLRATRTGDRLWFTLTLLLFPAVCALRIDMAVPASLTLLWPFMRDRVERTACLSGRSLWWRAGLLGLVATATLVVVYRFVALPSHHPLPEATGRMFALRASIPQFWRLAADDPGWVPLPAVLLAAAGALVMAVRRPLLLVRVAGTVVVGFGALGRTFVPDELVGARYFLFTIPVFLIASGYGFDAAIAPVPRRQRVVVAAVGVIVLGIWSGLAARTAYGVRYAFQDEYSFVRGALAKLPDGCAVYQVPVRADVLPRDLDCCLDLARSPVVLDFPRLQFSPLPDDPASVFEAGGCVAYYESVACEIGDHADDPPIRERAPHAVEYFRQRCAEVRRLGRLEPLAEITTSPRATVDFFHGKPPHAGLYRWTPYGDPVQ